MKAPLKLISPQAERIYQLMGDGRQWTANEIANSLNILPNAVYRTIKQLLNIGVVSRTETHPMTFRAVPTGAAIGWFLLDAQKSFRTVFGLPHATSNISASVPTISFIKTRQDLLDKTDKDTLSAKHEINFIVSGLEVPDSTIMAYRKAVASGVKVRALLQKRNDTSPGKLEKWSEIGVQFKYVNDLGIRLFVIDSKIVYLTAYKQAKKGDAFGIRFDYQPLAVLMNDLFLQKWETGST